MNLTAILADCYRRLRLPSAPAAATTTRLTELVNEAHRELLSLPGMMRLREDTLPVGVPASQARVALPAAVARIRYLVDRTNNRRLRRVSLEELRNVDPGQVFTGGPPERYADVGYRQVQVQPGTTGLWVVSSAAGDTTQKAYVESVLTGGYPQASITGGTALNGTTRVQIGARTDHIEVAKFYLDAVAVGFVSLYDAAAAGNELARIPIGKTFARYLTIELQPITTVALTLYLDYIRAVYDLANGTDEPLLPEDFHLLLPLRVRMKEYEGLDDTRFAGLVPEWETGKSALRSYVLNDGDQLASLRKTAQGFSQLGPMYPSGT